MSTLLMDGRRVTANNVLSCCHSRVLKSRENIFKPKCNKALKNKLKKYKLRRDGLEDPDIIDVSQTLINSLKIKSPKNINTQTLSEIEFSSFDENRPHNYLTKMVRLKKSKTNVSKCNNETEDETVSLISKIDLDKKQTDAFKVLMDSRHKSIGSNSPGKNKIEEDVDMQEEIEKKELKAKRILTLNKMAQAKGSLKNIEIEEYREEFVKRKMEERANRLKGMIVAVETSNGQESEIKCSISKAEENTVLPTREEVHRGRELLKNNSSILKTFDIFKDLKETETNNIKRMSKEDEEFLKKLSPSLRKKENMLSYFQKVSKDTKTLGEDFEDNSEDEGKLTIIKVKLTSKTNGQKKTSKYVLDKKIKAHRNKNSDTKCASGSDDGHKMKKNKIMDKIDTRGTGNNNINESVDGNDDSRPKRNTKRPIKYIDELQLSSSDEELHIFSPKKKRKEKHESTLKAINDNNSLQIICKDSKTNKDVKLKEINVKKKSKKLESFCMIEKSLKPKLEKVLAPKKAAKLAPIFVTKPQLDSLALKAKQKFLQSGVPKILKKNCTPTNMLPSDEFRCVVHVQNLTHENIVETSNCLSLNDAPYNEDISLREEENLFQKLLDHTALDCCTIPKLQKNMDVILKDIKVSYPKFPVYRTYHLLKGKSKGEFKDCIYSDLDNSVEIFSSIFDVTNVNPDNLNWADKYKPSTEKQVIGNFEGIKELKRWLVSWTESNAKSKKNIGNASDTSDFYQSDTNSRESTTNINNLLIITGKAGSGKTMSVYAVAAELAIKVIEVNASSKRTGKIMLQGLQEATQSHKVNRGKSNTECSQKSQDTNTRDKGLKVMKKRGRKKKVNDFETKILTNNKESTEMIVSHEDIRTGMSLILIDDADIVFDQDDGFCSAISQLIQTSKRPVILVTSSLTYPHLQKFLHHAKIIKMQQFLPKMLGTWLDIMCLVDVNICSPGLGAKTLDLFKGDIRKSINHLQFYMTSHKYLYNRDDLEISQDEHVLKANVDDETSCTSWVENEVWVEKHMVTVEPEDNSLKYFVKKQLQLLQPLNSFNSFNVWWNLPDLLSYSLKCKEEKTTMELSENDKYKEIMELNTVAGMLNTLSIIDYLEKSNLNNEINITSRPWYSNESASVIDSENFASYNRNNECMNDMTYELVSRSISEAQRILECRGATEMKYPSMTIHRERDRVVSRHKTLTSHLNPSAVLDRRALALDYWPSCRSICRSEKTKTDNNSKRNNRFCHYLKSVNFLSSRDFFDNLGESLSSSGKP